MTDRTCAIDGCDNPTLTPRHSTCGPEHAWLRRCESARRYYYKQAPRRAQYPERTCDHCGASFRMRRKDARFCSDLCRDRQRAKRRVGHKRVCYKCGVAVETANGPGRTVCDGCRAENRRDPERLARKERARTLRKYGLTQEQFDAMLEQQAHRCAICLDPEPDTAGKAWHIDHCHSTGVVRGLLCSRCNLALGYMRDSPALLRMAAHYLTQTQREARRV